MWVDFCNYAEIAIFWRQIFNLISSHTARRTGITLLLLAGIQPEIISKISGHADIRTLMKYIKIDQEHAIETVRSVWERENIQ